MPQPVLSLYEMVGGTPTPMPVLDFNTVERGGQSIEKTIRIYNNKGGGGGVSAAMNCLLTLVAADGSEASPLVQGVSPDFQPALRGRCLTLCEVAKEVELGTGNGANQNFPMPAGGDNTYVDPSMVPKKEVPTGSNPNSTWTDDTWQITVNEAGPSSSQPLSYLPPTFQVTHAGGTETYSTENAVVDYSGANPVITLDSSPGGPNAGKTPPTGDPGGVIDIFLDYRYTVEIAPGQFTVDASQPTAVLQLNDPPAQDCRVWGSWTYLAPEVDFEIVGGSSSRMDIGGVTTTIPDEVSAGLNNDVVAEIPDEFAYPGRGYAEIVLKFDIPANMSPGPNYTWKLKVTFDAL